MKHPMNALPKQLFNWLVDRAHHHSLDFQPSELWLTHNCYLATHSRAVVLFSYREGPGTIPALTNSPHVKDARTKSHPRLIRQSNGDD